jgi:DNA-binding NtrC family response regulator
MNGNRILVVDDEDELRRILSNYLKSKGYEVICASDGDEALDRVIEEDPDIVILDIKMHRMDGMTMLNRLRGFNNNIVVIILTAHRSEATAMEAIRLGACDYISKPFQLERIEVTVRNALRLHKLEDEVTYLKDELQEKFRFKNIVGTSPKMQAFYKLLERVVATDVTVLIKGATGTGKELIAQAIHYNSRRKDKPFLSVDCASLPETLVESELFGYEKGAFTGANTQKLGKFEIANGGTLFLDEIGNLPLEVQVKLLRVLENREIERLGGNRPIKIDVRLITATNEDLEKAVKEGRFREDLYYRLNVFFMELPGLKERRSDIPLLSNHFLQFFKKTHGKDIKGVSSKAMKLLLQYEWPGNVRELKNVIERAVLLTDDVIKPEHLPPTMQQIEKMSKHNSDEMTLNIDVRLPVGTHLKTITHKVSEAVERNLILKTLNSTKWNRFKSAQLLGVDYKTLYNKLKIYKISRKEEVETKLEINP